MFQREKVIAALEAKSGHFAGYEVQIGEALAAYEQAVGALSHLSQREIAARLSGIAWPGALPTAEHDGHPDLIVPFAQHWENHEQARAWARDVLQGVPTVAVDGSQITPTKDFSVPVGAVQIGWFVNPHSAGPHAAGTPYIKDISFEVLPPDELADEDNEATGFPDWRVNLRRFVGECEQLIAWMERYRDAAVKPVCFFDGSLVLSFAAQMRPSRQAQYVQAVNALLDASERYRVPLVGYVDTSYARDLVSMLGYATSDVLTSEAKAQPVSDGALLRTRMQWGDRSTAWICARDDGLEDKYYDRVAFVYLKTTADRAPSRLDVPRWLLDTGKLEHTLDVVRAECVVGNGYPYAVETADAVAVITMQDRERFYRVFQEFAEKEGVPLRLARKAMSKLGRR